MSDFEKSFPQGIRLDKPRDGAPTFVKGRVGVDVAKFGQWCRDNADDRGWVNFDLLEGKYGLYFQHSKKGGARIQSVERRDYAVQSKTDQPLDDDIPF